MPTVVVCPFAAPESPHRSPLRRFFYFLLGVGILFVFLLALSEEGLKLPGFDEPNYGLYEKVILPAKEKKGGKIAVIDVAGAIDGRGSHVSGDAMLLSVSRQLRLAERDEDVKAVILQIDSPGGGLTASDVLHEEIQRLRRGGKPVVVYIGGLAASGGFYIAAGADKVIASPTALVGSFGVIMPHIQVEELMRKIGVKVDPLKSTEMKDIGSPFREMTEEERRFFLEILEHYHSRFVAIIRDGRKIEESTVRSLANGKVYTAEQAKSFGLIDEIGYFDAALSAAERIANAEGAAVIVYEHPFRLKELFDAARSFSLPKLQLWGEPTFPLPEARGSSH